MQHYISKIQPGKPGLPQSMTNQDRVIFEKHLQFVHRVFGEGKIVFAGSSGEANEEHFAIVVLSTETKDQAVKIMSADPAIESGLLVSHITEFDMLLCRKSVEAMQPGSRQLPTASSICYIEIPAPDIEKAGAFYSSIFGWQIKPSNLNDTPYWEFNTGDGQISGGLVKDRTACDGGVLLYLKVDNIDATLHQVITKGGVIVSAKRDIGGGHGFSAFFNDPNGNRIGLYSPQ